MKKNRSKEVPEEKPDTDPAEEICSVIQEKDLEKIEKFGKFEAMTKTNSKSNFRRSRSAFDFEDELLVSG